MFSSQENFQSFLRLIESPSEDNLDQAIQIIKSSPLIAETFSQQSPKFVEIFSQLQPGVTSTSIAIKFYQIISAIFKSLIPKPDIFFRSLNYLSDSLIRRHLNFLLELMSKKRSRISLKILIQIASVHQTHCRDLFSSLSMIAFSNSDFRKFIKNEGLNKYIKLATIFLSNNEVSPQFLSTKYSLSPIWKVLKKVKPKVVLPFIISLKNASKRLNQSTKCWVFNDKTLKSLTEFPLSQASNEINRSTQMFQLLESIMEGENSIIIEDPRRVFCYELSNLDPLPRNSHILTFIKDLDVWKEPSHRELCLFIFSQSPDLIARFLVEQHRLITPTLELHTISSLLFISKIIEQEWPSFLYEDNEFINEGRSIDLLFESIMPSVLKNDEIDKLLQSSRILRGMIVKILIKSVNKFLKLPSFLRKQELFTKFRGRIPNALPQMLLKPQFCDEETVFPYSLKLLILLDKVFPFYISDSISKEPSFISKFKDYSPFLQYLILQFIPHLKNPLPQIKNLCSFLINDPENKIDLYIKNKIYTTLLTIIENSDAFGGFKEEIPIFVGESLRLNKGNELYELINLIKSNYFKYVGNEKSSPVCNALLNQKENYMKADTANTSKKELNPLTKCVDLISLMNGATTKINSSEFNISPAVIMANLKWYAIEASSLLLCTSIENNVTDLNLTLNCLTVVVTCDPGRTLKYVLNHPFIRSTAFGGSETLDSIIGHFIEWDQKCDEFLANSFLNGNVKPEVVQRVAPFIPEKFNKELLRKMIKCDLPIRPVLIEKRDDVISSYQKEIESLQQDDTFWKWAFKGFQPINLTKMSKRVIKSISKSKFDENLLLDLLRTIFISNDDSVVKSISLTPEDLLAREDEEDNYDDGKKRNDRLFVFAIKVLPSFRNVKIGDSLPVCFLQNSPINDPISTFENTKKEWSYEYLFQQIKHSEFERETSLSYLMGDLNTENKIKSVIEFYLRDQNDTFLQTFEKAMFDYLIQNPQIVEKLPRYQSYFFDSVSREIMNPSVLIEYQESQFEGIANILLGTTTTNSPTKVKISIRVILYLATSLSSSSSFYQLIEHAHISPSSFLFATGEVAKVVIQQIESNQKIYPSALCRNASYLAPFHLVHRKDSVFEVDTPFFRFLLHFAWYLLSTSAVPLENYIESGAVSILFRALSSKDEHARNVAYASLSELYDLNMQKTDYTYHLQLQLLLETLINAVTTKGMRFTSLITYFLTLASSIIIKPSHTIFTTMIHFLASEKTLRVKSVPLFNDLFGQNGLDFRNQRNWILKMLKNGVSEAADVELMKKSRIIEKLCSFFASPLSEMKSRKLILEILINASKYAKLDGIMIWAYSLMTEHFALPHIDQIVTLALSIRSKDEVEKDCARAIAELAWSNFRDSLDQSKEKVINLLSK